MTPEFSGTYTTRHGRRVVVTPVDTKRGTEYDLEYLNEDDSVKTYRESLPRHTVRDLSNLERWTKNAAS